MFEACAGLLLVAMIAASGQTVDLEGKPRDPFADPAAVRVLLFVRTDCPLTNRYAPELQRIAAEFQPKGVAIYLVYADAADTAEGIARHIGEYRFPGTPVRDPHHELVQRAQATIAPEAAVFDKAGKLVYLGRIDDRFVEFGKARPAPRNRDLEAALAAVLAGQRVANSRTRAIGCYLADVK